MMRGDDVSHGPTVTDHSAEKEILPRDTYWSNRLRKLRQQVPDAEIFNLVSATVCPQPSASSSSALCSTSSTDDSKQPNEAKRRKVIPKPSNSSRTSDSHVVYSPSSSSSSSSSPPSLLLSLLPSTSSISSLSSSSAPASEPSSSSAAFAGIDQPATKSQIFAGVCVYFDGRLDGHLSAHALGKLVAHHGGKSSPMLSQKYGVTHLVCKNLNGSKTQSALLKTTNQKAIKIVNANWIYESIRAQRKLKEDPFLVITTSASQPKLSFAKST